MVKHSKITLIHQDNFLIQDMLDDIAKVFQRAVLWDKKDVSQLQKTLAWFRYKFANNMPFERGSAAIGERIETAVYRYHGFDHFHYEQGKMIDLEALASPLPSKFLNEYTTMVSL